MHALLLTDAVDSTRISEALGDAAMDVAWAAHDRTARDLLVAWSGREIDKSDGMLLLFERSADALGYALALHRALAEQGSPLRVRAGIHCGEVALHANPRESVERGAKPLEIRGIAVAVTARIMHIAGAGQTLLSANALAACAVASQQTHSIGQWKFKGVAEPVELFEVIADGGAFRVPDDDVKAYRVVRRRDGWMPVREIEHSLPAERDAFVGRRAALHEIELLLEGGSRLVSIVGTGGSGKTRLAIRLARSCLGEYPGGAWLCELASARGLDGLHFAVAQGLGLQLGGSDPGEQIATAIAGRGDCLVILDNFEHLAGLARETLGRWLDAAPQACFLVTTRSVLGLVGENVYDLPPLNLDDATELFVRRAHAARAGFAPDAADLDAVASLARRLDGLPLAIELAAARVRVVAVPTLLQRMDRRFDLLASHGGRPDRQATLRATLDWSWDLLDDAERALFTQLSVFQGSFTIAAVEAVVALAAGADVLDLFGRLVDKSLVRTLDGERFGLLESIRDYAEMRLAALAPAAADAAALRARHWRFYAALAERDALAARCADLDNLIAACRAACAAAALQPAVRCLVNAWAGLRLTGPLRAAVDLAAEVGVVPGLAANDAALVHWVRGAALDMLGDSEDARAQFGLGLERIDAGAASEASARLRLALGNQLTLEGEPAVAQVELERALLDAATLGHASLQADALNALGRLMDHQARVAEARSFYLRALDLARASGDRDLEGGLLGNLGGLHFDLGELDAAREHYERSLAIAQETGDLRWQGNACCNLGLLLLDQGHRTEARTLLEQARELARDAGNARLGYTVACNLGILLVEEDRLAEAEHHLRDAVTSAARAADRRSEGQFRGYLAVAEARQGRLAEARAEIDLGAQALGALSDRLSLALLGCDRAEVEWLAGNALAAREAHAFAASVADELACGKESELQRRVQRVGALFPA